MLDKAPYTPGMREVLKLSKAEAGRLGQDFIGAEHYLLGLIRKGDGLAIQTLVNLDVDLEELKLTIERAIEAGDTQKTGLFAPNDDARRVLTMAQELAQKMKHGWVGTEHLLLALVKTSDTLAAACLARFGVEYEKARFEVMNVIEGNQSGPPKPAATATPADPAPHKPFPSRAQPSKFLEAADLAIPVYQPIPNIPRIGIITSSHGEALTGIKLMLEGLGCSVDALVIPMAWLGGAIAQFLADLPARRWGVAIVAAGKEPHAPAMVANVCRVPVIALPLDRWSHDGQASFGETVVSVSGSPAAVVAPNAQMEAALFAARIIALASPQLAENLAEYERKRIERLAPNWNEPGSPADLSAGHKPESADPGGEARSATLGAMPSTVMPLPEQVLDELATSTKPQSPPPAVPSAQAAADFPVSFGDSGDEAVLIRPVDFSQPLVGEPVRRAGAAPDADAPAPPPARRLGSVSINPEMPEFDVIEDAVDCLLEGGAIALPTDTVYGLAVDATNPRAVARLYELKQRPAGKAITLLIDSPRQLASIACNLTVEIRRLMEAFWPGPLTMIFEKRGQSFKHITSDQTIGVRVPDHPVPLALIQALARPLACTSANLSGQPDALDANTIEDVFGLDADGLDCLLDAGALRTSPPSTVLDVSREPYRILRQGSVTYDQLTAVVGDKIEGEPGS